MFYIQWMSLVFLFAGLFGSLLGLISDEVGLLISIPVIILFGYDLWKDRYR